MTTLTIISKADAITQGLKLYFTGKPCKWGHTSNRFVENSGCCECVAITKKAYRSANKDKMNEYAKIYYVVNKTEISQRKKKIRDSNRDKSVKGRGPNKPKRTKSYEEVYKEVSEAKVKKVKLKKIIVAENTLEVQEKKANQKILKAYERMLRRTLKLLEAGGTFDSLGYTPLELEEYLESLWFDGMSWNNYTYDGWHIEHIKSIESFIDEGITDIKTINALSNLRPVWGSL